MILELYDDLGLVELPIFGDDRLAVQWHELLSIWFAGVVQFPSQVS